MCVYTHPGPGARLPPTLLSGLLSSILWNHKTEPGTMSLFLTSLDCYSDVDLINGQAAGNPLSIKCCKGNVVGKKASHYSCLQKKHWRLGSSLSQMLPPAPWTSCNHRHKACVNTVMCFVINLENKHLKVPSCWCWNRGVQLLTNFVDICWTSIRHLELRIQR